MDSSCIYVGFVMHRRMRPRRHYFRYRAYWLLLDLDQVEALSHRLALFAHNRSRLFSLFDRDHGDGTNTPLRVQIDRQLAAADIDISGGRVSLLCMPRSLGYCFNPLSIFFCYDIKGRLAAIIYQVHNTFSERHSYVVAVHSDSEVIHQHCQKRFYVSPFLDMDLEYDFRITVPEDRLAVAIAVTGKEGQILSAVMRGHRKPLTDRNIGTLFLTVPALNLKVIAAIHWEALKLWFKRIGFRRRQSLPVGETIVRAGEVME